MAYIIDEPNVVPQGIAETSTTQNHAFGKLVRAKDPTYGEAEFAYVKGVSGGLTGLMAYYVLSTGATALTTTSGVVNAGAPIGIFMSDLSATTIFGWIQVSGDAVIKKTAVKVDPAGVTSVYLSATAGRVMQTSVAGRQLLGARWAATTTVTSTTSTAVVTLERPHQQGKIT